MKELLEWIYDNEALTENLDDEQACEFYNILEKKIEIAMKKNLSIEEIKKRILKIKQLTERYNGNYIKAINEAFE